MRYILALISILILSGCTTTTPAVTEYRVITDMTKPKMVNSGGCRDKSLKIAQAFSSSSLMSHHMPYMQGNSKQYIYTESRWSEAPNIALTREFLKHIKKTKLFKNVLNPKSRSKSDLVLEINIIDFMQYFNADETTSYVNVEVYLTLVDIKSGVSIATESFNSKVDVETLNAEGGVKGLGLALKKVIDDSTKWLNGVCK